MRLALHRHARKEIADAAAFYNKRNASVATRFLDDLERVLQQVARDPRRYRLIEPNLHQARIPGFPYVLIYRVDPSEIFVLAVKHDRRQPDYWRYRQEL
jgi:plasmid stabilization system protein ParE